MELFILLLLAILSPALLLFKRRNKKERIDYSDPYELTQKLQRIGSKEADNLIKELQKFKYRPKREKVPKEIIKRAKKILK